MDWREVATTGASMRVWEQDMTRRLQELAELRRGLKSRLATSDDLRRTLQLSRDNMRSGCAMSCSLSGLHAAAGGTPWHTGELIERVETWGIDRYDLERSIHDWIPSVETGVRWGVHVGQWSERVTPGLGGQVVAGELAACDGRSVQAILDQLSMRGGFSQDLVQQVLNMVIVYHRGSYASTQWLWRILWNPKFIQTYH